MSLGAVSTSPRFGNMHVTVLSPSLSRHRVNNNLQIRLSEADTANLLSPALKQDLGDEFQLELSSATTDGKRQDPEVTLTAFPAARNYSQAMRVEINTIAQLLGTMADRLNHLTEQDSEYCGRGYGEPGELGECLQVKTSAETKYEPDVWKAKELLAPFFSQFMAIKAQQELTLINRPRAIRENAKGL
jgi:hypothetical protein